MRYMVRVTSSEISGPSAWGSASGDDSDADSCPDEESDASSDSSDTGTSGVDEPVAAGSLPHPLKVPIPSNSAISRPLILVFFLIKRSSFLLFCISVSIKKFLRTFFKD